MAERPIRLGGEHARPRLHEPESRQLGPALPDAVEPVAVAARHGDDVRRRPVEVLGDLARDGLVALDAERVRADGRDRPAARRIPAVPLDALLHQRPARFRRRAGDDGGAVGLHQRLHRVGHGGDGEDDAGQARARRVGRRRGAVVARRGDGDDAGAGRDGVGDGERAEPVLVRPRRVLALVLGVQPWQAEPAAEALEVDERGRALAERDRVAHRRAEGAAGSARGSAAWRGSSPA